MSSLNMDGVYRGDDRVVWATSIVVPAIARAVAMRKTPVAVAAAVAVAV